MQAEADDEEWEYEDDEADDGEVEDAQAEVDDEEWEEEAEDAEAQAEDDEEEWEYEDDEAAEAEDADVHAEVGEEEEPVAPDEAAAELETEETAATADEEAPAAAEREVTLDPQPAPQDSDGFPSDELVQQAGDLILERQRVAVSLLQRTFELDFKQATLLLDALQQRGLIGPYLGGQKRDILLTPDEWRARV